MVQEWAARFERIGHRHAVGLDQKISRQIGRHVHRKQLSNGITVTRWTEVRLEMRDRIGLDIARQKLADKGWRKNPDPMQITLG